MNDLPPPLPTLCIRSIEAQDNGKFLLDMPSLWFDDGPVEVDQTTIDFVLGHNPRNYVVPACPPLSEW